MLLHVSSTHAYRQEAKIVLYSLWYHHTETSEWSKSTKINKITKIQFYKRVFILIELYFSNCSYFSKFRPLTFFQCDDTRGCIVQF